MHSDSEEKSGAWTEDVQADPGSTASAKGGATLEEQLNQAQAEARENHDLFLRERAELQNFKRRMQRESSESLRYASESLLRELLPVIDNLERAMAHAQPDDPLVEGLKLVHSGLLAALAKHGVERIEAHGQPFDPNHHQAMMRVESADQPANTVIEQHTSGYKLHDRLLRPAMVTVSAQKGGTPVESATDSD